MTLEHFYISRCYVGRLSRTSDGKGGWRQQAVVLHDGLRCRVVPLRGQEALQYQRPTATGLFRLYCNVVDISPDDRVLFNGKLHDILAVRNPSSMNHHLEVDMEQREVPTVTGTTPSDFGWST